MNPSDSRTCPRCGGAMNHHEPGLWLCRSCPMNDLQTFLRRTRGNESHYLGLLHRCAGSPVSDHVLIAAEIPDKDAAAAVVRLMGKPLDSIIRWLESDWTTKKPKTKETNETTETTEV